MRWSAIGLFRVFVIGAAAGLGGPLACTGDIGTSQESEKPGPAAGPRDTPGGPAGPTGAAGAPAKPLDPATPLPSPTSMQCRNAPTQPGPSPARRLTRVEYNNTVRDLLG